MIPISTPTLGIPILTTNPVSHRSTAYASRPDPSVHAFTNVKMPHLADLTPFLERNPVVAIVLMLVLLRSIRALCNRLLESARKK